MSQQAASLAYEWRRLSRAATIVAIFTSPALFFVFYVGNGWSIPVSLVVTFFAIVAFRGLVDVIAHRLIPRANLYGAGKELLEADVVARRRTWYWRTRYRRLLWTALTLFVLLLGMNLLLRLTGTNVPLFGTFGALGDLFTQFLPTLLVLGLQLPLLFFINFAILFGPLLFFGIKQMKGYEPGDADWGVKLSDVRGQQEPKEEITRVISLWQAGDEFKKAGGKPERGLLFLGAPGTGKTMLSKAIATSFNCPFMTMPGSGFAQTFIGMDVIVVLIMVARARRLARKWGGQCIVFIDEIDAVGMRRSALGGAGAAGGMMTELPPRPVPQFHGPWGALTASGDVVVESREWRDWLFAQRADPAPPAYPPAVQRIGERINSFIAPGMMGGGGGMALNQLLVQMDGVDEPPFMRRFLTRRINTFLDAMYVIPQRVGSVKLRLRAPKPRDEQIYFIGATNAPIQSLDPALIRPGRMGRHIFFRTPTRDDRKDIFDLYLAKVDHEDDLNTDRRRDELSRITSGYSPAMIEQVCSMALTYAHSEGRQAFGRPDILEAMTTIETGTAQGVEYVPAETRAVALHEAGHAVGSYLFQENIEATRLTVRKRGNALGHFQSAEIEERFSAWKSEQMAELVMILSAMATEHVFYGENGVGVGGDVQGASWITLAMVGAAAMGPDRIDLSAHQDRFSSWEEEEEMRDKLMERFERIGNRIIHRSDPGAGSPYAASFTGVLQDSFKRGQAAQILGQAFVYAWNAMRHNREQLGRIADVLVERRELHGDEVIELLQEVGPRRPEVDLLDDESWPRI
ncbi:MAG: cell division protease FtsH [Solirubrobacteraceae bacterium]|jgi:ATP-dependent Zn protease|nr:cell division protease FtsH [Solirubrobacteraceae bacterium]